MRRERSEVVSGFGGFHRRRARLIELESAFKNYPRSAADPDDKTEPYFYGIQEFKTVSKSLDRRTGRFVSNFQLSFSVKPVSQKSS